MFVLAPDRCPLSPCARTDPPQPVCVPPVAERFGAAGRWCSPLPRQSGGARVLAPTRDFFPPLQVRPSSSTPAACGPAPPARERRHPPAGPPRPKRRHSGRGGWRTRHRHELSVACIERHAGLDPARNAFSERDVFIEDDVPGFIVVLQMEKELNYLLQWKEKEGKELHTFQFLCQKKMLQDVKKQLQDMHEKINKLKEDFIYNLRILEERDKELEHYDVTVTHLKTSENAQQGEITDLRIRLGKVERMLVKERRKRRELHCQYRQHIEEHKFELEQFCSSRNSHIDRQHEEYVNLKRHIERKIQELEEKLACQKQVKAALQKTDYKLPEVKTVLSTSTVEREQAIEESFNCSILPEEEKQTFQYDVKSSLSQDIPTLEIKKLQEQNADLRAAIAQMRKEMESLDEQMLSSLPLTENRQLAERGDNSCHRTLNCSLCTNKASTGTTLSSIKVSSTNLDCIVNPDTEKGPRPKVLEEKMVDPGQELPEVGPSVGLQYGVSCTVQGMQNKLKEAARKISILSQEKQQLIDMGNRVRAELGMVLKEGLWHTVSPKHCTVCIASDSLLPRELVKRTQCQLSALKHLQHRLTTQELQYAKQQHPLRISSLVACPSLKEEEASSGCGAETEFPSTEVQLDFSIENHGPEQHKADTSSKIVQSQPLRQRPSPAHQVQVSSSREHNFCQGIWQTLEMGSSPYILSPQNNTDQVEFEVICSTEQSEESQQNIKAEDKLEMPAADLTVRGTRLEVQQKLKSRNLSCAHPIKQKISSNMAKIRNYNLKD
ncbi:LOW QUALITY PROTEIN: coiled-coil domain-containing protein 57 [Aegotheles albertisi]